MEELKIKKAFIVSFKEEEDLKINGKYILINFIYIT